MKLIHVSRVALGLFIALTIAQNMAMIGGVGNNLSALVGVFAGACFTGIIYATERSARAEGWLSCHDEFLVPTKARADLLFERYEQPQIACCGRNPDHTPPEGAEFCQSQRAYWHGFRDGVGTRAAFDPAASGHDHG